MIKVLKLKISNATNCGSTLFLNKKEKGIAQMSKNLKTTGEKKSQFIKHSCLKFQAFRLVEFSINN